MPGLVQAYNSTSKKWVLINTDEKGGIVDMQQSKFEGIPVKGKSQKTYNKSVENVEDQSSLQDQPAPDKEQDPESENKDDSDSRKSGFFGW